MEVIKKVRNRVLFSIKSTVVGIFIFAVAFTAAAAIGLQYYFSHQMAVESATKLFNVTTQGTASNLAGISKSAENTLHILAQHPNVKSQFSEKQLSTDISDVMQFNPHFYAIYLGLDNGDFFELINLQSSPSVRNQLNAQSSDYWVVIEIIHAQENQQKLTHYYDQDFVKRATITESSDYDPRDRMWFKKAQAKQVFTTKPYLFQHLQAPGQTYSIKLDNQNGVIAIDIALSSISQYLITKQDQDIDAEAVEMYLFQDDGQIIASNGNALDKLAIPSTKRLNLTQPQQDVVNKYQSLSVSNESDWAPIDFAISGNPDGYSVEVLNIISQLTGLHFNFINGYTWHEMVELFKQDKLNMLNAAYDNQINRDLGLLTDSFLQTPFAIVTKAGEADIMSLTQLHGKTLAISEDWSIIHDIRAYHPQINLVELPNTHAVLKAVTAGQYYAGIDNQYVLQYIAKQFFISDIQYHLNLEQNTPPLLAKLHFLLPNNQADLVDIFNLAIKHITPAQREALRQKWLLSEKEIKHTQTVGTVPYQELIQFIKKPYLFGQLHRININQTDMYIYVSKLTAKDDYFALLISEDALFAKINTKLRISILVTVVLLLILLPLCWIFASPIVEPIKNLAIESIKIKNRQYAQVKHVETNIIEIEELADSIAAMVLSIQQHEQNQKDLMDSFIELIAQAIDDKSPYTAGHCERVPELGMMLAQAAAQSSAAPFIAFKFENKDAIREFKIAAWLHDCGKITTPEHIVDKGTKLETIYNRIHEIRMRFEVLWRDAEVDYLKAVLANPEQRELLNAEKEAKQQQLTADFTFIANANVGGEFIDANDVARIRQIATITWQRNFDDTLGLSPIEELRFSNKPTSLPVIEQLLSDKPSHIIAHDKPISYDESLGIKMQPTEHRANLGEVYNLIISRGTLTAEDRFKINEHIISTIKMLDRLPFPAELAKVPRYASTHHETLIGTGYPRKLTKEQLSIPERVLVLADIFEALTAADRPYKKAKPLSVAINILHKMALDQHVDLDVFKLFISSGIYLQYAAKFLHPDQLDEIDVDYYLNDGHTEEDKRSA
ncbi:transporter substrate-binding domain-containing protein [Pseudoalteromonas tunicata]|uniref:HD domain-containing phosphohydrolase n=1 Tax=Pseudoalteromonas tunicata TaxID=314281 RepID=UPI00273D1F77|nr:HD domain-containing phosphohydrolase [Pseudoalteromonas tunicata]MDP5214075.1 transporter substrate-binding domain-containing protein [Pseudoalteromonas tunicata]